MEMLELTAAFNVVLHTPLLKSEETKAVLLETGSFHQEEVCGDNTSSLGS